MASEIYGSFPLGRFEFKAAFREVAGDQGVTIHVFGPAGGKREEVLRFDCFERQPHYHLGWSYRDQPFIRIEDPDPLEYSLQTLASPNTLLVEAGAESMDEDELSALPKTIHLIRNAVTKARA